MKQSFVEQASKLGAFPIFITFIFVILNDSVLHWNHVLVISPMISQILVNLVAISLDTVISIIKFK